MIDLHFEPSLEVVSSVQAVATLNALASEPKFNGQLFDTVGDRPDYEGSLTQQVLDSIAGFHVPPGLTPVIDTRVHRLMPGMYPAIPGWHCDDWPRPKYHSQPDPASRNIEAFHFTCTIDGPDSTCSQTQFLDEPIWTRWDRSEPLWKRVHGQVEAEGRRTVFMPTGLVHRFSGSTIHRATPALNRGWRYWFRLSMMHRAPDKTTEPGPEIAYVLSEENGW